MYQPLTIKDRGEFDLDGFRARMASYLGGREKGNRIFFDALEFAHSLHAGQKRKSGAPYISHPCAVAEIIVREFSLRDPELVAAAVLHDVLEDVPSVTFEHLASRFGTAVSELVDGCTKLTRYHRDKAALKDLTHSKILLTASRRLGILIIKLADRLHNLRTLHYLPKAKRQRIAQETIEVYAPLAAKLNIFPLKRELYHLALSYLYPKKSKKILNLTRELHGDPAVLELQRKIRDALASLSVETDVRCRLKGLGTYYNPGNRTLRLSNAESRVDFTVVVRSEDILNCYGVLGSLNRAFPPIPRTLRDFIANPKNNGYMSLHTRIHFRGENYLIKIRTSEMDERCRTGILAYWEDPEKITDEYLHDISDFLRTIGEYGGAGPQRKALLRLSESEEITVYTPVGDALTFPMGSIVLDFAYKIHSDLGDHCRGAMVNNERAEPTQPLKDGDTVEVLTSPEPLGVYPELEELCRTPKARAAVNKALSRKRMQHAQRIGKEVLDQELMRHGFPAEVLNQEENVQLVLEVLNVKDLGDLFARIGQDLLSPHAFLYYFKDVGVKSGDQECAPTHLEAVHRRNVLLVGEPDPVIHKFARCCRPYPGQEGVVATLSERGVTFHRPVCEDLSERHDLPPQSLLDVVWVKGEPWPQPMVFQVRAIFPTQSALFAALGKIPAGIHVTHLECRMDQPAPLVLNLEAVLRSFEEARRLFECFPDGSAVVENFGPAS